jgi:transcriptional regulator with XRE-family HTH domain
LGFRTKTVKARELKDFEHQLWVAESMRQWIGVASGMVSPLSGKDMGQIIRECVDRLTEGNAAAFGRLFKVNQATVRKWLAGRCPPPATDLLRICQAVGAPLAKFLTGRAFDDFTENKLHSAEQVREVLGGFRNIAKVKQALEDSLNEEPPLSMRELSVRLNYKDPNPLYSMFPELCKKISERHQACKQPRSQSTKVTEKQLSEMHSALEAALKQDSPPALQQVANTLGFECVNRLYYNFPNLCRQIVTKRSEHKKKAILDIKLQLEKVLQEDPPPPIKDVAARFGYKCCTNLSIIFPESCVAIRNRHNAWKTACDNEVLKEFEEALSEIPPPSFAEVARRLHRDKQRWRKRHPELCRAISKRRREFRRQSRLVTIRAHREEVEVSPPTLSAWGVILPLHG